MHEYYNPFGLKADNLSQRNCKNQLSHPGLPHREQECQDNLIKQRPQIFVKLSFREFCDLKLSSLHAFDNMIIIH